MSFFPKKSKSPGSPSNAGSTGVSKEPAQGPRPPSQVQSPTPTQMPVTGTDRRPVVEGKPTIEDRTSEAAIRARAHQIWIARGGGTGDELADWLLAQRELQEQEEAARRSASAGGTT